MQKTTNVQKLTEDTTNQIPVYIDEHKVSEITGRALPTLRNDRHRRRGIPYCKIGRSVRYSLSDVIEYVESHKIIPGN
ncbi:MAG: helix-turn-helix domain-containing protein [Desulfobacterales bacterium]|jgi:hypothetical protein